MRSMFGVTVALALAANLGISSRAAEIKVFAAASLTDAMQTIAHDYESQSADKVVFNFAGSNVLARQIAQGAPANVFFSADEREMDAVANAGLIAKESRRDLLSNTLVVIVPADSSLQIKSPSDLSQSSVKRIALGDPQTVPAGVYAKAYLTNRGIWPSIQARITPTENVRAALAAVASGNVEAGIVYKTDAMISSKIKIAFQVSAAEVPPIVYPIAIVKGSESSRDVKDFLDYLESPKAAAVFAHYGFRVSVR